MAGFGRPNKYGSTAPHYAVSFSQKRGQRLWQWLQDNADVGLKGTNLEVPGEGKGGMIQ